MKKIKLLIDKILAKIEQFNPDLYRKISYDGYKKYSEMMNYIKYKDRYFFHLTSFWLIYLHYLLYHIFFNNNLGINLNLFQNSDIKLLEWEIYFILWQLGINSFQQLGLNSKRICILRPIS